MRSLSLEGRGRRVVAALVAGAAAVTVAGSVPTAEAGSPEVAAGHGRVVVRVTGLVQHPLRLTLADLRRLPRHRVRVTYQSSSGSETHTFAGPLLYDVLEQAAPIVRADVKNDLLRDYVAATAASDGYEAVVAWGEIDPSFEGKTVLVALREDGAPLAPDGLRLVVPGDAKGGRYVTGVTSLRLGSADLP